MALKTQLKTGARDVLRSVIAVRIDLYVLVGAAIGLSLTTMVYAFYFHEEMPMGELQMLMEATGLIILIIWSIPVVIAFGVATALAIGRRKPKWGLVRGGGREYIHAEEHERRLQEFSDELRDELRAELGGGGE